MILDKVYIVMCIMHIALLEESIKKDKLRMRHNEKNMEGQLYGKDAAADQKT